jgi:hypothetical protein
MITPRVDHSDRLGYAALPVSLVTRPDREGKRATPPLGGSQFLSNGSIPRYGTVGLFAYRLAADPAHPIGRQFRTSGGAVG